jgi:hypothetical protein
MRGTTLILPERRTLSVRFCAKAQLRREFRLRPAVIRSAVAADGSVQYWEAPSGSVFYCLHRPRSVYSSPQVVNTRWDNWTGPEATQSVPVPLRQLERKGEPVSTTAMPVASASELQLRADLEEARDLGTVIKGGDLSVRAAHGGDNLWLAVALSGREVGYVRLGPNAGKVTNVQTWSKSDGTAGCDFTTPIGPVRAKGAVLAGATIRYDDLLAAGTGYPHH